MPAENKVAESSSSDNKAMLAGHMAAEKVGGKRVVRKVSATTFPIRRPVEKTTGDRVGVRGVAR